MEAFVYIKRKVPQIKPADKLLYQLLELENQIFGATVTDHPLLVCYFRYVSISHSVSRYPSRMILFLHLNQVQSEEIWVKFKL